MAGRAPALQPELVEEELGESSLPTWALVLGDGDGRFTAELLKADPTVRVDYVDNSAGMVRLARTRVAVRCGEEAVERRVTFYHADAREWVPPIGRRYGLITTHFFLDCLTEPEVDGLAGRLKAATTDGAIWIISEFHQPTKGVAAWRARAWIGGLYRLFSLATGLRVRRLPDYESALDKHGFRRKRKILAEWGLLVSEWWEKGGEVFPVDAPDGAHLHSPTPKS